MNEAIRQMLAYDPATGVVRWLVNRAPRKAGDIAGGRTGGYWKVRICDQLIPAHRIGWFLHYGSWPTMVDHANGDTLDNRIENLRECTPMLNQLNAKPRSNKSGHKGVSVHRGGFQARIRLNKRIVHLGTFDSAEDAAAAYAAAAVRLAGSYAYHSRAQAIRSLK